MDRREFLPTSGTVAGVATIGGVLQFRANIARSKMANQLVADASSILIEKKHT